MNKIITLLLLSVSLQVFSQDKAEIKEFFWGKTDNFKTANTVPDKWKNESAVIIYKHEFYDYHKFGVSVTYTSAIRKRIKLLDAAAVKEFSEFSFKDKFYSNKGYSFREATNTIGVKIVKSDGKEIEIDVEKEAKVTDNEKKIAIANLEVGDVIDYYFYSVEPFKSALELGFEPVETTLGDIYPTMEMKLVFQTENDFFVNFNTYNGAPKIKEIPTQKSGERKYELEAHDIEKNEFPKWFNPLAEMPCYKFQVFFARSGKFEERADAFLSKKESIIKETVSKEDIFEYYNDKFRPEGDLSTIKMFLKDKAFANDEEKIREVYYFTRHNYLTQYIEAFVADEAKIFSPYALYVDPIFFRTEREFINHFMAYLKYEKIDYDIIIGTERYNGSIDDLLIQKNVTVLLKINTPNPIYLEFFTPFTNADQFNYNLENTKAYALQVSKGKKVVDSESILLPSTTVKDNVNKEVTNLSFNEDFSGLKIKRESSLYGQFKPAEQKDKFYFFDYVYEDYDKYKSVRLLEKVKNKTKRKQYQQEFDALINKLKDRQKEEFKKNTSNEYGFEIEDHSLVIKNTGRFGSKSPMVYEEEFLIKNNLIKKAGDNYILEIGKMLTSQIEINKKEKERKNNIYMSYPRAFENEIIFDIPAGYTVSGIEKLNKKVSNETGQFISEATLNGNKLIIKTSKQYQNYFEPNSNWGKMVQFLDAAYQFTQEKVLLKKA